LRLRKRLVPVLLDDYFVLPKALSHFHWIDFRGHAEHKENGVYVRSDLYDTYEWLDVEAQQRERERVRASMARVLMDTINALNTPEMRWVGRYSIGRHTPDADENAKE
jgi:hypothetical protein